MFAPQVLKILSQKVFWADFIQEYSFQNIRRSQYISEQARDQGLLYKRHLQNNLPHP